MQRRGGWVVAVLVVLGALRALADEPAPAETPATTESAQPAPSAPLLPYHLTGAVSGGYRFVDQDGSRQMYRDDYNLMPGGRLFLFTLDGEARDPDKAPLDPSTSRSTPPVTSP